ncbi:MAG: hypothetical protein M1814_003789 [Vezdaea aestivalis]|nr:MAG: hypothetical protein M1814_003789 [Vezdaea aestivalis]
MGTFNIITDLILVVFPVSIILASQFTTKRKIQLTLLFALSFIPIAATGYRVPKIIQLRGRQQYRTLWASLEILAATGAANAIVIGSFIRDRGPKKSKYKFGSTTASHASLDRTPTQRRRLSQWGSDEDLFGGTGVGLSPDLRKLPDLEARPAPVALPPDEDGRVENAALSFSFRKDDSSSSSTDLKGEQNSGEPAHSPGQESTNSNQKTGFFDVGGLLDTATPRQSNMAPKSTEIYDTAITRDKAVAAGRRGSEALLHDIGGLLTPVSDVPRRPSLTMKPAPAALPPPIHPHRAPSETSKTISTRGRIGSEDTLIEVPAHILARNHRVADVEPSQPSTARSQTLQSLQDAGGLLSTTEQNDYAK